MLNLILKIMVIPFIPFFMYGNFFGSFQKNLALWQKKTSYNFVLGEAKEKKVYENKDGLQKCNLFPVENENSQFTPVRKKGYGDTKVWAGSSVAIDVDSGTILHYENGRKRTQIASLTKMMTAVLAMENIKDLDHQEIILTTQALNVPGTVVGCPTSVLCTSNRMYRGEKVMAIDLMKAMLLNSANDAATALGIQMAGSEKKFVDMMNDKAKSLGLKDTHFCTPSGLEIDGEENECYSSAYDIARIAAYSLRYQLIWDIMKIPEGQFYSTDGKYMHVLKNTDILLGDMPNCIGGKTGFTPLAGKSLLLGSYDPTRKHRVIGVVLDDNQRWEDMRNLMNWVFESYEWK